MPRSYGRGSDYLSRTPTDRATQLFGHEPVEPMRDLLRMVTCGSVDDGKSTFIGRLLYDARLIPDDQVRQLERDSRYRPVGPEGLDFSLIVDGLEAEREQGITIDVAYRFFATPRRAFIVADGPGHEQYTRNMLTGASTSELAVVLVDARKGVTTQTVRHTMLCGLVGIRDVLLLVNKMDLVTWDEPAFRRIEAAYEIAAERANVPRVTAIPISALQGDNVVRRATTAPWFSGAPVLEHLESVIVPRTGGKAKGSGCRCNGSIGLGRISGGSQVQ